MFSIFTALKRKFTSDPEEEELESSSLTTSTNKKQQTTNLAPSLNLSPTFLAPSILPGLTNSSVESRPAQPLITIKVMVKKIEEPVLSEREGEEQEQVVEEEDDTTLHRTAGVDPFTLPTLTAMYESDDLESVALDEEVYPYDAKLNEKVVVWRGDITSLSVDAIVNAANTSLLGGGGVDGAIHRAAGPDLYDECVPLNGARTGESKITGGHDLPSLHVIHTVGPIYSRSKKTKSEELLRSCYTTTLQLAVDNNCKTLGFSGISTGVYGYPLDDATRVALDVTRTFLSSPEGASLDKVIFTVFRQIDVDSYISIIPEYFPNARQDVNSPTGVEEGEKKEEEETKVKESESEGTAVGDEEVN